jgi:hypothetical protein
MGLANFTGAAIADAVGYGPTFIAGFVLSATGCLFLVRSVDRGRCPARLANVWQPVVRVAPAAEIR